MNSLVFFVETISSGLYILCAAGILWMGARLLRARRDLALAQFKLEREQALVRRASAITLGGLLVEMLLSVWAISVFIAPEMRDLRVGGGTTSDIAAERFVTSTPAANAPLSLNTTPQSGSGSDEIFATPAPTATLVGTIMPDAGDIVGCPADSANIEIPANGQLIFESTTVIGTASISNFAFYRFEIKQDVTGAEFAPIGDYDQPVTNGPLGDISPLNFAPGRYRFRVTVFDNTQWMRALCEITIFIGEPEPTPTSVVPTTDPSEGIITVPTPTP
ncbi:MAG TPA: hypothetical protein PKD09_22155 [Aggregatilinea sp.]|jgi:hypothetical protein|uniref:hypothetical protein n=1 Tax=Aggregatilinea sp. TaxID=2806333 RepID=UPI002C2F3AEA|nr:hypothetical protein [Aggregatilinea sp.]HML24375.1 hypothetical protein [Aggregatilinea sp.]